MKKAWVLVSAGRPANGWQEWEQWAPDERPLMYRPDYNAIVVRPPVGFAYQVMEVPDDWELQKYPEVRVIDPVSRD